jgi:tRNA(Ile)-lysidine synthase TilS/MesJ
MNIYTCRGHNINDILETNRFRFSKDKTQICENVGRQNGDNMGLSTRPKYNAHFPGRYLY